MKKVILIAFFAVFAIALGYLVISQRNKKNVLPRAENESPETITKTNIVRVEGAVTDVHNGCWADGVCSIEVDGKWWIPIIKGGLRPPNSKPEIRGEVIGIVFNEENESIGKKVEIYAKKVDENSLTIFGNKEYYVKVVGE